VRDKINVLAQVTMLGNKKYRITNTKTIKISFIDNHKYSSLLLRLYISTTLLLLPKREKTRNTPTTTSNKLSICEEIMVFSVVRIKSIVT